MLDSCSGLMKIMKVTFFEIFERAHRLEAVKIWTGWNLPSVNLSSNIYFIEMSTSKFYLLLCLIIKAFAIIFMLKR